MRIISDFKDYYDCMQASDEDKKTLWVRNEEKVNPREETFPWISTWYNHRQSPIIEPYLIGFCGKLYPVLKVIPGIGAKFDAKTVLCRNIDDIDAFMSNNYPPFEVSWFNRRKYGYHLARLTNVTHDRRDLEKFFYEVEKKRDSYLKLFEVKRTPIFVASSSFAEGQRGYARKHIETITYNARLRDLEFMKVFGPPQAYQEILMFMNNMAVPMKPIPKIDDETMAEIKGFDRKTSFRKEATRKRKK